MPLNNDGKEAFKALMKAVVHDLHQRNKTLMEDLNQRNKTLMEDLRQENKTLMKAVVQDLRQDIQGLRQDMSYLIASNPQAAMLKESVPVVAMGDTHACYNATMGRGTATWTYMKVLGRDGADPLLLAVSCEHCALPYRVVGPPEVARKGSVRFVSIPLELIVMGVEWVGLLRSNKYGPKFPNKRKICEDISIVCLKRLPVNVGICKVPEWPSHFPEQPSTSTTNMVAGSRKTGIVRGGHFAEITDGATSLPSVVFVEDPGEASNSGNLMFELIPSRGQADQIELRIIGVYWSTPVCY